MMKKILFLLLSAMSIFFASCGSKTQFGIIVENNTSSALVIESFVPESYTAMPVTIASGSALTEIEFSDRAESRSMTFSLGEKTYSASLPYFDQSVTKTKLTFSLSDEEELVCKCTDLDWYGTNKDTPVTISN